MAREPTISVIDYGVGNNGSVLNMLRHIGVQATLVDDPEALEKCERLLLPGVGAFDRGMQVLQERGLAEAVVLSAAAGTPVLGICLGMQLLSNGSDEGQLPGLGLVDARCHRLPATDSKFRVPHMGWSWVDVAREHTVMAGPPQPMKFYFAHSYHMVCADPTLEIGRTDYAEMFTSVVGRDNVLGTQFHPEKSHAYGMALLRSFSEWSP